MNLLSIMILLVVAVGAVYGYVRGIVKQIGSLVAVVLAVLACRAFGAGMAGLMHTWLGLGPVTAQGLGYALVFLIVWLGVWLVARALHAVVETVSLGWLNSGLGALFMTFKFMMVLSMVMNIAVLLHRSSWLHGGDLVNWAMGFAPEVWGMVNTELQ